jgi:hypothetical protein
VDLFWQHQGKNWAVEFKYLKAPRKSLSMQSALKDLDLEHLWVVYPGSRKYRMADKITALPLSSIADPWSYAMPLSRMSPNSSGAMKLPSADLGAAVAR